MSRKTFAYITAMLIDLSNGSFYLGLVFHLKSLGASKFEIGLIGSSCPFSYAICCIILARYFPNRSHINSMRLGLGVFLICLPLLFFIPGIWWAVPFCFFFHLANALYFPALQIWMTEGFGRKALQKVMGTYGIAWTSGFVFGPLLGSHAGLFWEKNGLGPEFQGPYLISLVIVIAVFLTIWRTYKHNIPNESSIKIPVDFSKYKTEEFKNYMMLGWMTNTLGNFCSGLVRFLIPLLLVFGNQKELILISMEHSGYLVSALAVSLVITVFCMRNMSSWILNFKFIIIMELLVIPSCFIFLFSHHYLLYFLPIFIFGMINSFGFYTGAVYSLQLGEKGLKYITINEFVVGLGAFLGALTGGLIAHNWGSEWAFASPILMVVLMIILQLRLKSKINKALRKAESS
ncbi:MAG: hypothetical protein COA79_08470 [Planctomycetota bacterium]|nr:MAG: hypothetical protein COA79_08470 [Planctomycetota bacterium]